MKSIEDRLDNYPEPWMPEKAGEKIVGTVVEADTLESKFGGDYPLVVVETAEGKEVAIHAFHTVLKSELARRRPKVGDRIGVAYHGKDGKGGYEKYRVIVERDEEAPDGGPDWDAIGADAQAEFSESDAPPPSDAEAPQDEWAL